MTCIVEVQPLPLRFREIPERWRPGHPPVFTGGEPTAADIELARELFLALDPESQRWYRFCSVFRDLLPPAGVEGTGGP